MYALSRTWCDMTRGGKDNGIKSRRKEEGSEAQDWCSYTGTDAAVTQFPFWLGSTLSGILGSLRCHSFALSLSLLLRHSRALSPHASTTQTWTIILHSISLP